MIFLQGLGSFGWSDVLNAALVAAVVALIGAIMKNVTAMNKLEERVAGLGTRITNLEAHFDREIGYLRGRIDSLLKM